MNLTGFLISPALRLSFTRFSRGYTFCCRLELGGQSRYVALGFMRSLTGDFNLVGQTCALAC